MSTFGGLIDELPGISIDKFNGLNLHSKVFFLSHCHTDHMDGLSDAIYDLPGPLYLSNVSAVFIQRKFPHLKKLETLTIGGTYKHWMLQQILSHARNFPLNFHRTRDYIIWRSWRCENIKKVIYGDPHTRWPLSRLCDVYVRNDWQTSFIHWRFSVCNAILYLIRTFFSFIFWIFQIGSTSHWDHHSVSWCSRWRFTIR